MTAFSNGFEFDAWASTWCDLCVKDDRGYAPEGTFCKILTDCMATNVIPEQWNPGTDDLRDRYHCKEFEGVNP